MVVLKAAAPASCGGRQGLGKRSVRGVRSVSAGVSILYAAWIFLYAASSKTSRCMVLTM